LVLLSVSQFWCPNLSFRILQKAFQAFKNFLWVEMLLNCKQYEMLFNKSVHFVFGTIFFMIWPITHTYVCLFPIKWFLSVMVIVEWCHRLLTYEHLIISYLANCRLQPIALISHALFIHLLTSVTLNINYSLWKFSWFNDYRNFVFLWKKKLFEVS
jgi:hypothetical protein